MQSNQVDVPNRRVAANQVFLERGAIVFAWKVAVRNHRNVSYGIRNHATIGVLSKSTTEIWRRTDE